MIIFWIDTKESIKLDATQTTHASHMFSHVYTLVFTSLCSNKYNDDIIGLIEDSVDGPGRFQHVTPHNVCADIGLLETINKIIY